MGTDETVVTIVNRPIARISSQRILELENFEPDEILLCHLIIPLPKFKIDIIMIQVISDVIKSDLSSVNI